jgi:hypothetical protein
LAKGSGAATHGGDLATLDNRSDEEADFIHKFFVKGLAEGRAAPLDQYAGDAALTEFLKNGTETLAREEESFLAMLVGKKLRILR